MTDRAPLTPLGRTPRITLGTPVPASSPPSLSVQQDTTVHISPGPSRIADTPYREPSPFSEGGDDEPTALNPEDQDSDSEDDMPSDITFSGKASELPGVLAHCQVTFLSKASKYSEDTARSAYLASLFRGPALDWLGTKLEADKQESTNVLDSWDDFTTTVKGQFGISDGTKERVAEQAIRRLRQTGSCQKYANDFDKLSEDLSLPDDVKVNLFRPGLKPQVAQALVGKNTSTWDRLKTAAIEADEELFAIRQQSRRTRGMGRRGKKKDGAGKN